ncbi:MAG: amino acid ABC transporter permease, partial [Deltaproteobacteria bacterium]
MEQKMSNIKRLSNPTAYAFSVVGFIALMILVFGSVYYATVAVEYQWRWFKIPKYFMYQEAITLYVEADGEIESIAPNKDKFDIVITDEDGQKSYTVPAGSFDWDEGDSISPGDIIAEYKGGWKPGLMARG